LARLSESLACRRVKIIALPSIVVGSNRPERIPAKCSIHPPGFYANKKSLRTLAVATSGHCAPCDNEVAIERLGNVTLSFIQKIYDQVHIALWAMLAAFVIYFAAFVAPKIPESRAAAEATRFQKIAAENEAYCSKWHMGEGTAMHSMCLSDLRQLRTDIATELSAEAQF
jgi:hypothetical protein